MSETAGWYFSYNEYAADPNQRQSDRRLTDSTGETVLYEPTAWTDTECPLA